MGVIVSLFYLLNSYGVTVLLETPQVAKFANFLDLEILIISSTALESMQFSLARQLKCVHVFMQLIYLQCLFSTFSDTVSPDEESNLPAEKWLAKVIAYLESKRQAQITYKAFLLSCQYILIHHL